MISWDVHSLQNKDKGANLFCSTPPGLASLISLHATITAAKVGRTKVLWKGLGNGKDDSMTNFDLSYLSPEVGWRNDVDVFLSVLLYHGVYLTWARNFGSKRFEPLPIPFPKENVAKRLLACDNFPQQLLVLAVLQLQTESLGKTSHSHGPKK